jgi:hypothetical protein
MEIFMGMGEGQEDEKWILRCFGRMTATPEF